MRLFVAVDVDDDMRAGVGRAIDALRAEMEQAPSPARISWLVPERLHLTLQFIGHVSEAVADAIAARVLPAFPIAPFSIRLGGMGTFPSSGRPRVVWLGVEAGADGLAVLHAEVTRRLADIAFPREARPFSPHLTLARFKPVGTRAVGERIAGASLEPLGGCTIDRVTLYQSRLSPRGPTYTPLVISRLDPPEQSA
jgi:RNA 2',3'-cyclic 3'-phosphodiesterase